MDASPSDDGDWISIKIKDNKKPTLIHKCIFPEYILMLENYQVTVTSTECIRKLSVSMQNFAYSIKGRPIEEVKLDVLKLQMLSRDIGIFTTEVELSPHVSFRSGGFFFKVETRDARIILTKDQQELLLGHLYSIREGARARDEVFMSELENKVNKLNQDS